MTEGEAVFSNEDVGGCRLRVARWRWDAPSDHPPVLFFNGLGMGIEAIAPLARALNDRPFIVYDMPGTGGSAEPALPYTAAMAAWQALELVGRFEVEQVDVMGLSWGGGIAQQFALQHSAMVRRLVLMASSPGMPCVPGSPAALMVLGDGPLRGQRPATPLGYACQLLAMAGWSAAPLLPLLSAPTLILMGECDEVVPLANGHILHALIPGSRLDVVAGGGHLFVLSHLARALALLRSFLDAPDGAQDTRKAA